MSSLLLEKLLRKWKSNDHLKPLENRMKLWQAGEIMELLNEVEIIQKDVRVSKAPSTISKVSKKFTLIMRKGNINNAMKLLADNMQNGILPLTHSFPMHPSSTPCPPLARYVRNCYYANTRLFIIGGSETQSIKRTTQGDPKTRAIYATAIIPLILMLVAEANQDDNCSCDNRTFKELVGNVL